MMQVELSLQETEAKVTYIMYLQCEPQNDTMKGKVAKLAGSAFIWVHLAHHEKILWFNDLWLPN